MRWVTKFQLSLSLKIEVNLCLIVFSIEMSAGYVLFNPKGATHDHGIQTLQHRCIAFLRGHQLWPDGYATGRVTVSTL